MENYFGLSKGCPIFFLVDVLLQAGRFDHNTRTQKCTLALIYDQFPKLVMCEQKEFVRLNKMETYAVLSKKIPYSSFFVGLILQEELFCQKYKNKATRALISQQVSRFAKILTKMVL